MNLKQTKNNVVYIKMTQSLSIFQRKILSWLKYV